MFSNFSSMFNWIRRKVSLEKKRYTKDGFDLDLAYIGPRIIAMGFPSEGIEGLFRNQIEEVKKFLDSKHPDNFWVFNLCAERTYHPGVFHNKVSHFPFIDHNPPPLDLIRRFCNEAENFLKQKYQNVVVIHGKAGKGRTGVMTCCLLMQMNLLPRSTSEDVLHFYAEQRTQNKKGITVPSQIRYVKYYEEFLRSHPSTEERSEEFEPRGLRALSLTIKHCPKHLRKMHLHLDFKTYDEKIFIEFKIQPKIVKKVVMFQLDSQRIFLIGDVKMTVHLGTNPQFSIWFNTEYMKATEVFRKPKIDVAFKDPKIPDGFKLELVSRRLTKDEDFVFAPMQLRKSVSMSGGQMLIHPQTEDSKDVVTTTQEASDDIETPSGSNEESPKKTSLIHHKSDEEDLSSSS